LTPQDASGITEDDCFIGWSVCAGRLGGSDGLAGCQIPGQDDPNVHYFHDSSKPNFGENGTGESSTEGRKMPFGVETV
jgi:hypothetical protein